MTLISRPFTVSAGKFIRTMVMRRLMRLWYIWLLPLACAAVLAYCYSDVRWIIVALMILLIILPMLMAWAFFTDGLSKEGISCYFPRILEITHHKIVITFLNKEKYEKISTDSEEYQTVTVKAPKPKTIMVEDIEEVTDMGKFLRIKYRDSRTCFIDIPFNIWKDAEHKELMEIIDSWHKNC
ncbi:MAG: hypothetical protein K2M79_07430 [Muribaculaceae bacterium]|nr:hypothetical protein [Muribaculaceae bacterium]